MQPTHGSIFVRACGGALAIFLASATTLAAQTGTVTGRVTDANTGNPIASAQVFVSAINIGALTQQNGAYNLLDLPAGTHEVTVQRLGYRENVQPVTVTTGGTTVLNFVITEAALQLDEIIATGTPGGTQRRALGNAVVRLEASQVAERAVVTEIQDMLSARTPGLNFQRVSGNVGGGSPIRIRGVSSLELGAEPLIYVDGVRIDNDQTLGPSTGDGTGGASNALNDINPADIESIEVIKGPSAATLYGSEASSGVIQITTKRGQAGAPEFTFTTRQGAFFLPDPEGKLGTQYYCEPNPDGSAFSLATRGCPEERIRPYNIYAHERDYNGNEIFQYGLAQGYNLSVRGGTDNVRYFLSGDWSDDNGIVSWNYDNSISGRANISVLLTEDFSIDASTGYVEGTTRYESATPGQGGIMNDMKWAFGDRLNSVLPEGHPREAGLRGFQEHTPEDHEAVEATREYSRFTGSLQAQYTYGEWLTQRFIVGLDKGWDTNTRFHPLTAGGGHFSETVLGQIVIGTPEVTTQTFDYGATARLQATEALGTATSFGIQYNSRTSEQLESTGRGFSVPVQTTVNQTAQANLVVDYDYVESKSFGVYVQEELSWRDRIFVTAAVRADDNSTFGSSFDLVYYPKFSAAWVISEEDFWNVDFINSLRLRGAWGEAGRQPSAFAGQNIYVTFAGPGGAASLRPSQPGNPEIGPERSSEIESGFDFALFDDRVSGEFTYFDKKTFGAITDDPLSPSMGFPGNQDRNLGELHNWGWELAMNNRILQRDNVALDMGVSATYIENMIRDLGGSLESNNFQRGHPYPAVVGAYLLFAEGPAAGQTTTYNRDTALCDGGAGPYGNLPGGEAIPCVEIPEQQLLYGPSVPPWTITVSPTLTLFNDLQLFLLAEGQYGGWFADIQTDFAHSNNNTFKSVCRCDPVFEASEGSPAFNDERYQGRIEAKFWKAREIGFRYNLPENLVQRMGADRASLSVSARNWWVIWNGAKTDLGGGVIADPESRGVASGGTGGTLTNTYAVPGIANVSASMRVTF